MVISVAGKPLEWIVEGGKTEAEAFEALKRTELRVESLSTRVAPRFSEFCRLHYVPFVKTNLKKTTWAPRLYTIATLAEFFGEMKLIEIGASDVETYKGIRSPELAASSMNAELRTLGTVLRHASAAGFPAQVPPIRYLREPEGRVKVWNMAELSRLFVEAGKRSPEMLRMIVFLLNTGMRKGECLAAEWSWVDFPARMLSIPATAEWTPKSGRAREVPISDACMETLTVPRRSDRWIFPSRWSRQHARFPDPMFEEIQRAAGLSGGPHSLRHSFASHFLQTVPDLFLLAKVLGHSHGRVTELYAHLLPEHLNRARNAVNLSPPTQTMAPVVAALRNQARKARNAL